MITGTGAIEREKSILFVQLNGVWYPIGEDNESLERTRNNTVTQTKNVLGKTKTKITKGNQTTCVLRCSPVRNQKLNCVLLFYAGQGVWGAFSVDIFRF